MGREGRKDKDRVNCNRGIYAGSRWLELELILADNDRGMIWVNLDWTRSAGVDRPGLTLTHVNGINLLSIHSVVYVY